VLNPLPIDLIHREAGDILIAVNVNANIPYTPPAPIPLPNEQESYYGKVRAIINERWSGVIDPYVEKYRNGKQPKPKQVNMFDVISESINLAQNKAARIYIEKYKPDVVIETSFETATAYDFYKSEELIEAGRDACRKALEEKAKK
jgi:NTE family protein